MFEKVSSFLNKYIRDILCAIFFFGIASSFILGVKRGLGSPEIETLFVASGIVFVIGTVLLYIFFIRKNGKPETAALAGILISGIVFMTVCTPYTIPDEPLHHNTAYSYSNLLLGEEYSKDDIVMRKADYDFYTETHMISAGTLGIHISSGQYENCIDKVNEFIIDSEDAAIIKTPLSTIYNRGVMYIVPALGISLGRVLHLNSVTVFDLGRLFNLILYAVLIFFAVKKTPVLKSAIACVALLPMSIQLAASYSYDCFNTAFLMLMLSYILSFIFKEGKISVKDIVVFLIIASVTIPLKVAYWFLVLTVLFIPKDNLGGKLKSTAFKLSAIILPAVFTVLIQIGKISGESANTILVQTATYTPGWVVSHIPQTIMILIKSAWVNKMFYIETALGSGLGWLQIVLPRTLFLTLFAVLFVSLWSYKGDKTLKIRQRVFSALIFIVGSFAIMGLLMLDWTPMGADVIQGVQGRYFIPFIPLLALVFGNQKIMRKTLTDTLLTVLMFMLNFAALFNVLMCIG